MTSVVAPTRREIPGGPKLIAPTVDFGRFPVAAEWWKVDAVACALGTTIKAAGSRGAFRKVDHDYVLGVANAAKGAGAETFVLNSAMGADPSITGSSPTAKRHRPAHRPPTSHRP